MKNKLHTLLCVLIVFMPNRLKIFIYNNFLNATISPTAKIGFSYINAKRIIIGSHAKIGHLNIIKNIEELQLGDNGIIGNAIKASAIKLSNHDKFIHAPDRLPALRIGNHSAIVSRHYFDCNDTITIGNFVTIAGHGSSFFTHGINVKNNTQETGKIVIGNYTMVGTQCVFLKGSKLPNKSVLAANSTMHKPFVEEYGLYSGVPAIRVKDIPKDSQYFNRSKGVVD